MRKYTPVWTTILVSILTLLSVQAHVDTTISLKDGKLIGLPKKYQPAEFSVKENRLRIKDNSMYFHDYIKAFFDNEKYQLEFLASWYHEGKPYFGIGVIPEQRDYSYYLWFDLDTLELLDIKIIVEGTGYTRHFSVKLNDYIESEIQASISKVDISKSKSGKRE